MPGPAPKHPSARARRNDAKKDFRSLPSGGRSGSIPEWPLVTEASVTALLDFQQDQIASIEAQLADAEDGRTRGRLRRELAKYQMEYAKLSLETEMAADAEKALWAELWSFPQAVMWEETRSHRSVALYVRCQIKGENGNLKAAIEARQREDRLGLNDLALLRLRAEVERVDEAEDRGKRRRTPPKKRDDGDDPRSVLRAVN